MKLLNTSNDKGLMIARMMLGIVFFPHGAQKLLGWYGGFGYTGTMDFFTGTMGLPWLIAFLVIIIEFFGSLLLILGLATRVTAFSFSILTLGIIFSSHIQNGFFMNWFGNQKGEGYEYFLLALGLCIPLVINGGGAISVDRLIHRRNLPQ